MPVYEYVCATCERRFERLQGMTDAHPACPRCGQTHVHRRLSVFAAVGAGPSEAGSSGGGCACGGACACRH